MRHLCDQFFAVPNATSSDGDSATSVPGDYAETQALYRQTAHDISWSMKCRDQDQKQMDRTPISVILEVLFSRKSGQRHRALSLVGVAPRPRTSASLTRTCICSWSDLRSRGSCLGVSMSLGPKTTPIRAGLRPVSRSHDLPAFCGEHPHIAQRQEIELRTVSAPPVSPMSDPEAVVEHLCWQDAGAGERVERKRDRASSSTVLRRVPSRAMPG